MMMNNDMMPWGPPTPGPPPTLMWGGWGPPVGPMGIDADPLMAPPPPRGEVIRLRGAVLFPPPPFAKQRTFRERPPGCRTIFVGGLPENVTEDILTEMFEICGIVVSVRLSKKNFAHIRFEMHSSVERALLFSGFRMIVGEIEDSANAGCIHVDYAEARDDLHEYDCMQRAFERENRLRERMEEEMNRPPSPPKVIQFSDHEALMLIDTLKADETFLKSTHTLVTWFDRGDCNRRTSSTFYSLLHSTNVHIRRLMSEKAQYTKELEEMKSRFQQRFETLINQLDQIEKVFNAASKQKSWDHFTKAQRKNIEAWRKQLQELKAQQEAEFFQNAGEAEMELSDGDDGADVSTGKRKRSKLETSEFQSTESMVTLASDWASNSQLRDENENLKCQLEAYKNEANLLKQESQNSEDAKDKQIKQLQMALQGMQQKLISYSQKIKKSESEIQSTEDNSKIIPDDSCVIVETEVVDSASLTKEPEAVMSAKSISEPSTKLPTPVPPASISNGEIVASGKDPLALLDDKEARLVALVTTFLHVHPFGANIDYIWSYLHRLGVKIRSSELEDLLEKYPSVFGCADMQDGAGHSADRKWKFVGYKEISTEK